MKGNLEAAQLFEVNVGQLAWSYTFLSQADRSLLHDVRAAQMEVGRAFDRHYGLWSPHPGVRHAWPLTAPHGVEVPSIPQYVRGMCLVMKPPGWEVDTEGDSGLRHLSGFLQTALPADLQALAL